MNVRKKRAPKQELTALQKKRNRFRRLLWMCRSYVVATAMVSVWANTLHVQIVTAPALGIAVMPPVIVLAGYEIASRVPLTGASWMVRWARPVALAGISVGAGWLSYFHQKDAIRRWDSDPTTGTILPLLIDGLMIIASVTVGQLNALLENLDTDAAVKVAGQAARAPRSKPEEKLSDRERIARIVARSPELSVREIARQAGTKEPYTYNVVGQLRKLPMTASA